LAKRALIILQRDWAIKIGLHLSKKLIEDKYILSALTLKKSTHNFFVNQSGINFCHLTNLDSIMENPHSVPEIDKITLEDVCKGISVNNIWSLFQERLYVRNYNDKYYYSFRQNRNDEDCRALIKAYYISLSNIFKHCRPEIIISPNFAGFIHGMLYHFGKKYNVPMFALEPSFVSGIYSCNTDYSWGSLPLETRFKQLTEGKIKSENIQKSKNYINLFREKFIEPTGHIENITNISGITDDKNRQAINLPKIDLKRNIRIRLRPLRQLFNGSYKGTENKLKKIGNTPDSMSLTTFIRDYFVHKKNLNDALKIKYSDSLPNDFAYLPLQVQPEQTIDMIAPWFNNQIEVARLVAQSLPGNMSLIVKEHPAMLGKRSLSYYEKLNKSVNVSLVSPLLHNSELLNKASIVIATTGTSIFESSIYKKPVIQLGDLSITQLLPNVYFHNHFPTLGEKISEILNNFVFDENSERFLTAFISSIYDTGYKIDYGGAVYHGRDLDIIWEAYKHEISRVKY
tara:strand:+ start:950 stop:2488 length:1539 start_codon:yes stop_codon:yes gene_type:complete